MLRCLFFISVLVQCLVVQAQNSVLTNAILYRNDGNLLKAKEEIDKACLNEKTMKAPKAWYYKGVIYNEIFKSTSPAIQALDPDALNVSYAAFRKVYSLETPPAEYSKKSDEMLQELWAEFINSGVKNYESGVFLKALNQFEHAQEIKPQDTTAYVYALYAADEMNNGDLSLRYCDRLTAIGYKSAYVYYVFIDSEFNTNKNPEKAFAISRKALKEYPNDKNLLGQQTDMYIRMNRSKEALTNLLQMYHENPSDVQVLINIGSQYDKLKDQDNAILFYKKVLVQDSLNYVANYNMAIYSIKQSKVIEQKIVKNDSSQLAANKLYKIDYAKDLLRIELKKTLDTAEAYYGKAKGGSKDASERKNLELVMLESTKLRDQYLKAKAVQAKK